MSEPGAALDTTDSQPRDSSGLVLAVIAMVLLIVGGGWLFLSFGRPEPAVQAPVQPPAPKPLEVPAQIDPRFDLEQNLDMGQLALDAGQLVEPPDGSALYFFLSAREQAPGNVVADAGLLRIASEMALRGDAQLAGEEFAALDDTMRVIERIDAQHPELARLRAALAATVEQKMAAVDGAIRRGQWVPAQALLDQLARTPGVDQLALIERADALQTAQAERAAAEQASTAAAAEAEAEAAVEAEDAAAETPTDEAPAADAQPEPAVPDAALLLSNMVDRIERGDLLSPPGNSARDAFNELARTAPDDSSIEAARRRLVDALADRATALGGVEQFTDAGRLLDAAELLAPGSTRVAGSRETLLEQQISLEGQRLIPVGEMVRTRATAPRFPRTPLRNGVGGFVLLNFTVLRDGSTTAIEVVETSEDYAELFSRAAVAAVERWEFVPRRFLGEVIDQRVQARLSFEVEQ